MSRGSALISTEQSVKVARLWKGRHLMHAQRKTFNDLVSYDGPLARLSVVTPSTPTAGEPFRVIVEAQNSRGFTIHSFQGDVRLSAVGGEAELPGKVSFQRENRGVVHVEAVVPATQRPVRIVAEGPDGVAGRSNPIVRRSDKRLHLAWGDIHAQQQKPSPLRFHP